VATLAVVAGVAYGGFRYVGLREVPTALPTTAAQPTSCADPVKVRLSVAPAIAPAVAAAAESLAGRSDGPCAAYLIDSEEPFSVAGSLGGAGRPDAWITDSSVWVGRANAVSGSALTPGEPFASNAVLVAMRDETASGLGSRLRWADLLGGPVPMRIPDPNRSAIARIALGVASTSLPDVRLRTLAATSAPTGAGGVSLAGIATADRSVGAVVSQAQLVAWNAAHPDQALAAVAPSEGAPALEYSLVSLTKDPAKTGPVAALEHYLASADTRKVLQDSGFRTADGDPKDPSPLYGEIRVAGEAEGVSLTKAAGLWNAAARKTQALLAVDVSGSMLERTDNGTRLKIVQKSTARAVAAVSPTTIASLWIYSLHVGSRADDYRQLTDYGGLGVSKSLGALDDAVARLDTYVGGGSGLYDTIAAAYDRARSAWRPGYANTLIVIADGPNEDDYGLTLELLKKRLVAAKDPARPVRVVVLGIGGRADEAAMRQVVAITGGQYVSTGAVEDLQPALTTALGG
ncbi:MAG: substrate-binding domain-containing protein, partial [Terrabacter sp.]|nr:substrate-binding domain-containing protein [Terrabacter sp.]